jgi:hypothetical protein
MRVDIWTYRPANDLGADPSSGVDIAGYDVEALDGSIGKIDKATNETAASLVVVDTGPWIFGKKVLLPAGVIGRIDPENETVEVHRTKDEIKNAPEYDETVAADDEYRSSIGDYYGSGGAGWRDWDNRAL